MKSCEGLSPLVGAVLVIGIFTGLAMTLYSSYSKAASRNEEGETLTSVLRTFLELREEMEGMENGKSFSLPFKLNVGGRAGGTLWVKPETGRYGRMGFTSQALEIGNLTLVLEGGLLGRLTDTTARMLSPPPLLRIGVVREENMVRWLRVEVRHFVVENSWFQLSSTSPLSLRFTCTSDSYTVLPGGGFGENARPNRENVEINLEGLVSPETREAWREALRFLASLYPPHYGVSVSPDNLILRVVGYDNTPGVRDILYYERWTRVRVEVA